MRSKLTRCRTASGPRWSRRSVTCQADSDGTRSSVDPLQQLEHVAVWITSVGSQGFTAEEDLGWTMESRTHRLKPQILAGKICDLDTEMADPVVADRAMRIRRLRLGAYEFEQFQLKIPRLQHSNFPGGRCQSKNHPIFSLVAFAVLVQHLIAKLRSGCNLESKCITIELDGSLHICDRDADMVHGLDHGSPIEIQSQGLSVRGFDGVPATPVRQCPTWNGADSFASLKLYNFERARYTVLGKQRQRVVSGRGGRY